MCSFASGEARAKMISRSPARSSVTLLLVAVVEPLGVDDQRILAADPDLAGDRRRGQRMIAGDHDHADPGAVAAIDRCFDLGTRRVEHRHQPEEAKLPLGLIASGRSLTRGRAALCERKHPEPLPRAILDLLLDPAPIGGFRNASSSPSLREDAHAQR